MKGLLTILSIIIFYTFVLGQQTFGIKINMGLSNISNPYVASNVICKTKFLVSGQEGLYYNLFKGNKSVFGGELLLFQIESKEKWEIPETNEVGDPTGISDFIYVNKHITYFGIPLYYGFKINKFTIYAGGQASFVIFSSGRLKYQFINTLTEELIVIDTTYKKLNIDSYDYGVKAGLIYNFSKQFALEGSYYYGLNNIFKDKDLDWTWKNQQITLGLRCTFLTRNKNDKNK